MLTEQMILKSVTINLSTSSAEVEWRNEILRDGEVISSVPYRRAYMESEKAEFLTDVDGAENYITALGWQ